MPDASEAKPVYTIGHSNHEIGRFTALLRQHGISAVADVRSAPYSRFNPQFNREALREVLRGAGIDYVFLGMELGARSEDPVCYVDGRVQYDRLARTALFRSGIERVLKGRERHRVALMCAEKDPLDCHRTLLVARALDAGNVPVTHILADGRLESHDKAMGRLLGVTRLPETDLFRSREQLIDEACSLQERRVAYVDEDISKRESEGNV